MTNKTKTSNALLLSAIAGMLMHPDNTIITNLLAIIPCIGACVIIAPLIKELEEE